MSKRTKQPAGGTPATVALSSAGVAFTVHSYEHDPSADLSYGEEAARAILGLDIRGHVVRTVLVELAAEIAKEYYLSITFDRGARAPLLMLTTRGGVDVEQVAA